MLERIFCEASRMRRTKTQACHSMAAATRPHDPKQTWTVLKARRKMPRGGGQEARNTERSPPARQARASDVRFNDALHAATYER